MRLKSQNPDVTGKSYPWLLVGAIILSLALWNLPIFSWLLAPIDVFVTTIHELSHAVACIATGGHVTGLTIVNDNQGHGGLTFCSGGIPLIYTPAGYLGTAIVGCVFLFLGRGERMSRFLLFALGCAIGLASLSLMVGTVFSEGRILEGIGSIVWGMAMAAALVWSALNLRNRAAHFLFLFLAAETALNSVASVMTLLTSSFGFSNSEVWSDATNMQKMTMIPAPIWSLAWAAISIVMVLGTLWLIYGGSGEKPRKEQKEIL